MGSRGFTIIELALALTLMAILFALLVPSMRGFQREAQLAESAENALSLLERARARTLSSLEDSSYGVYFDAANSALVLFRGASYEEREEAELFSLPSSVEIEDVQFSGGSEVVFQRVTGATEHSGYATFSLSSDSDMQTRVSVSSSGTARVGQGQLPSDEEREKDSRHVHVDYGPRTIDPDSEVLVLLFSPDEDPLVREVPFSDHMNEEGLFSWEGTVEVHGEEQEISVLTHWMNDPDETQFSIRRDRRKNSKELRLELQGDGTGSLVFYHEDGTIEQGTSIYAHAPVAQ